MADGITSTYASLVLIENTFQWNLNKKAQFLCKKINLDITAKCHAVYLSYDVLTNLPYLCILIRNSNIYV